MTSLKVVVAIYIMYAFVCSFNLSLHWYKLIGHLFLLVEDLLLYKNSLLNNQIRIF